MQASKHTSPIANYVRKAWIGLTFLLLAAPVLIGGGVGLLVGAFHGLRYPRRFMLEIRAGVLNGAIRVTQGILPVSSKVYAALFARHLYVQNPLPRLTKDFLIVGHRGAPTMHCENTIASFAAALGEGANALEIDLCLTQDGEVVIWHDWDPSSLVSLFREGGLEARQAYRPDFGDPALRRRASALTLADLRARYTFVPRTRSTPATAPPYISTFREFLQWAVTQKPLKAVFLDIKVPPDELGCVEPLLRGIESSLAEFAPAFDCLAMTIFPEVQARMQALAPSLTYCFDVELTNAFMGNDAATIAAGSTILHAERLKNRYCSVGRPTFMLLAPFEVYREVVLHDLEYRQVRQLDIRFISWTINDPEEQKWLVSAGVDGILTDLPHQLAQKTLGRKTRHLLGAPFRMLRQRV